MELCEIGARTTRATGWGGEPDEREGGMKSASHRSFVAIASLAVALASAPVVAAPLASAGPLGLAAAQQSRAAVETVAWRRHYYGHRYWGGPGPFVAGAALGILGLGLAGGYYGSGYYAAPSYAPAYYGYGDCDAYDPYQSCGAYGYGYGGYGGYGGGYGHRFHGGFGGGHGFGGHGFGGHGFAGGARFGGGHGFGGMRHH